MVRLRHLVVVLSAVAVAGCGAAGPKLYRVSGEVKYKGEPVKAGSINFQSDAGNSGSAPIADGRYDIPGPVGLVPGVYKVAIYYPDPKAPQPKLDALPGEVVEVRDLLPAKYNTQSELRVEVKPESNELNFDLK